MVGKKKDKDLRDSRRKEKEVLIRLMRRDSDSATLRRRYSGMQ